MNIKDFFSGKNTPQLAFSKKCKVSKLFGSRYSFGQQRGSREYVQCSS